MARSIWTGSISFGLVNIPVKLYSAVAPKEVRFHMLHDEDGGRIHQKRVCSVDGEEVPYEHIVKGYEIGRGRYVTATREELEKLDPKATRTIDIEDFVEIAEIDPIYYEHTYYLFPGRGAAKAYALLKGAMDKAEKIGIARFVMRTKQYLCAVRPMGRVLALSTMFYGDEVIAPKSVEDLPPAQPPAGRELTMAEQLIETLTGPFDPRKYDDEYRGRVLKMLKRKAEGKEIVAPEVEERPAEVVNLLDALKASLQGPTRAPAAKRRSHPRQRRTKKAA